MHDAEHHSRCELECAERSVYLRSVSNQSIFTGVLNREIAFTALLSNLLRRPGEFREAVYKFLTGNYLPKRLSPGLFPADPLLVFSTSLESD
jgi:hypothetical protein